ncbi:MAG TPA: polymer-forming cytoskeletal protein [Stellaceae bacterium]|nr:polymer-forming cytoskeletal protein [Stellaceae bacterium]
MTDAQEGLGLPPKPLAPRPLGAVPSRPMPLTPPPPAPAATSSPTLTPTPPVATKPGDSPPRRNEGHAPIIATPRRDVETRRLIVGREISLTGEITSCERLIVEGSVEANLTNCRDIEIAETGLLKGTAAIEEAEIRGRFEGTLTVRKRLLIRATGKVTGLVRYGQLEVEAGGQLSGDIQAQPGAEDEARPQRTVISMSGDLKV